MSTKSATRHYSIKGIVFDAERFAHLPAEVALRLLGRAIAQTGDEGPVEFGKLETLQQALESANRREIGCLRRTLGGALVTLTEATLAVERAPARKAGRVRTALTTGSHGGRGPRKRR